MRASTPAAVLGSVTPVVHVFSALSFALLWVVLVGFVVLVGRVIRVVEGQSRFDQGL